MPAGEAGRRRRDRRDHPHRPRLHRRLRRLRRAHPGQPQRGPRPRLRRPLRRHRARAGPPLGQPVHRRTEDLGPRPQLRDREAQGQRPRRQPDRDRGDRRLEGHRHRRGALRGRRLRELRPGPGRVGAAEPGHDPPVRRPREGDVALRSNPVEIAEQLRTEIQDRLAEGRRGGHRGPDQPPRLRPGDRQRDAPPPAGERGHRGPLADRRGRGGHGRDGARAARRPSRSSSSTRSARPRW